MKHKPKRGFVLMCIAGTIWFLAACSDFSSKKSSSGASDPNAMEIATYGNDLKFLQENRVRVIELSLPGSGARVLIAPGYQGRVMTSSADGNEGDSFGWINYKLIRSGKVNPQFNPIGGEERFWLGPEGGPYSLYFAGGKEQIHKNWKVPPVIDTDSFDIKEVLPHTIRFGKEAVLTNAAGYDFHVGIDRQVNLLPVDSVANFFRVSISDSLKVVAYETINAITNLGSTEWSRDSGLLSVWMLSMFNPSPSTTVFIPFETEATGDVVRDEYFGKVPPDRLRVEDGLIWFRIDGKLRSKIGVPPQRSRSLCGSYDDSRQVLTLLWCSLPETPSSYVNSQWGHQDDPYDGDVVNSYNDGPLDDGSVMGPFYEIETSSPAAALRPGESLTHVQRIVHLQGDTALLSPVVTTLFGVNLRQITSRFQ